MTKRDRPSSALPIAVLLAAILLRGAVIVAGSRSLQDDPDAYARLAVNWAESGVYGFIQDDGSVRRTAFRPPLYPWLLSWVVQDGRALPWTRVAALHFLLSAGSVALVFSIARSVGVRQAWLPAAAWACDPLLLRANQLVMTETLAACLVLIAWQLWLLLLRCRPGGVVRRRTISNRRHWMLITSSALGLAFGIAMLARPTAAPWAALCVAALVATWGKQGHERLAVTAVVSLGILCCVVPWTIRNYYVFGKPIWATTHGGYTLLLANNPQLYDHFRRSGPSRGWHAEPFHRAWAARLLTSSEPNSNYQPTQEEFWFVDHPTAMDTKELAAGDYTTEDFTPENSKTLLSEVEDDALAYASAQACILRSPSMFVTSAIYRVGWFWALWPFSAKFSWSAAAIGCWYGIWFLLAIRGVSLQGVRSEYRSWLPAVLLVLSLTAIHGIYWSNMRMRGPLMSTIYVMASVQLIKRKSE